MKDSTETLLPLLNEHLAKARSSLFELQASQIRQSELYNCMPLLRVREKGMSKVKRNQILVWREGKAFFDAELAVSAQVEGVTDQSLCRVSAGRCKGQFDHFGDVTVAMITMGAEVSDLWSPVQQTEFLYA